MKHGICYIGFAITILTTTMRMHADTMENTTDVEQNTPAIDLTQAEFPGAQRTAEGVSFSFNMGNKRVNWTNARWSHIGFDKTTDWSAYRGLRIIVRTDQPRDDAAISIALREDDGSWHYLAGACDLIATTNTAEILFADFRVALWVSPPEGHHLDDNQVFDPDIINGLAVGVVNPLGIGNVDFELLGIELLPLRKQDAPRPVTVTVSGRTLDINATEMIPGGLFGHFPGGGAKEMRMGSHRNIFRSYLSDGGKTAHDLTRDPAIAVLIDVKGGDRYQPSMRLTSANWQENCRNSGLSTGRELANYYSQTNRPEIAIEWWNEPYLNWSNRTRRNFDLRFFDESRAEEGGPVHLTVDGSVAPFLRWTRDPDAPPWLWMDRAQWRAGRDAEGRVHRGADMAPPDDLADGETYTRPRFRQVRNEETGRRERVQDGEIELTAFTPWYVYDLTQFTFWSGQSQLMMYNEPMLAFAGGLKETYPEAVFLAGWDFRVSEDYWAAWHMLYKPTIDAGIAFIDGVTDHDYGGDVTRMPANYEFVTAYGMTRHNKWLLNYNTECGENSDPSAYPEASASMRQAGKRWLKAMWSARKLVHALATVPDKARSFTFHWFDQQAEGATFMALRNLRGRLVHAISDDSFVYVAAAIDGTDPLLPRPDYMTPGIEMVVAIYNDHRDPREITVPLQAPTGTKFKQLIERRTRAVVSEDDDAGLVTVDESVHNATGSEHSWSGSLDGGHLVVLTLPLEGTPLDRAEIQQRQFFANALLENVSHQQPVETSIAIDSDILDKASRAWLRVVVERVSEGEAQVEINGAILPLPRANTPVDAVWMRDIPLDPSLLKTDNILRFSAAQERAGWLLACTSIYIEGPAE